MNNRECINCKNKMKEALVSTKAGVLIIEQQLKGLS